MNVCSDNVAKLCKQLKNMFDFLLASIEQNQNVSLNDICYFVGTMNILMEKICKEVEK